jgi:hypothetical protein
VSSASASWMSPPSSRSSNCVQQGAVDRTREPV